MAFLKYLREMTMCQACALAPCCLLWGLHFQDAPSGVELEWFPIGTCGQISMDTNGYHPYHWPPDCKPSGSQPPTPPRSPPASPPLRSCAPRFPRSLSQFRLQLALLQPAEVAAWAVPTHPPDYEGWGSKWTIWWSYIGVWTHARHIEQSVWLMACEMSRTCPNPQTMPPKRRYSFTWICWRNLKDPQKNQTYPLYPYIDSAFLVFRENKPNHQQNQVHSGNRKVYHLGILFSPPINLMSL